VASNCGCGNEPPGSKNAGNYLTSYKPVTFSRRTVLHGVSKCLCSCLSCQVRKANAPYYIIICGLSVSTLLFHITSQKARYSRKGYGIQNACCYFVTTFALDTSHLSRNGRHMAKIVHRSSCKVPVILVRF
jgi:hypothetical protein